VKSGIHQKEGTRSHSFCEKEHEKLNDTKENVSPRNPGSDCHRVSLFSSLPQVWKSCVSKEAALQGNVCSFHALTFVLLLSLQAGESVHLVLVVW
jgi:hypothetical protein